jgi:hypothetical protein
MILKIKGGLLFLKGAFQDSSPILHALQEILHLDLESGQALGPFGQDFFHFPLPIKHGLDFFFNHFFIHFLLYLFGPGRFILSRSHGGLLFGSLSPGCPGERENFRVRLHPSRTAEPKDLFNLAKKIISRKGNFPFRRPRTENGTRANSKGLEICPKGA